MKSQEQLENIDYEALGFSSMMHARNLERAKALCLQHLQALFAHLEPAINHLKREAAEKRAQIGALIRQLYQRAEPLDDRRMIALRRQYAFYLVLVILAAVSSLVGHYLTIALWGAGVLASTLFAIALTGLIVIAGWVFFEILLDSRWLHRIAGVAIFALAMTGILLLAQARGVMTGVISSQSQDQASSYVESDAADPAVDSTLPANEPTARDKVARLLTDGTMYITLAADIALGLLLAMVARIRHDPDFANWRHLEGLLKVVAKLEHAYEKLEAIFEVASRKCTAGMLKAANNIANGNNPPYFRLPPLILILSLLSAGTAFAQDKVKQQEIYVIDISASVGQQGTGRVAFADYMSAVRGLLASVPESTRVWVFVISDNSFGGGLETILRGFTPAREGIFTDKLDRARRELVQSFQAKTKDLQPTASATDIFGALAKTKATYQAVGRDIPTTLYLFSDMTNTAGGFSMPSLLPAGVDQMIGMARKNGLIVSLDGARVCVYGAVMSGMSPSAWGRTKDFWTRYFELANARLEIYSPESIVRR